jgi:hypothetical protein
MTHPTIRPTNHDDDLSMAFHDVLPSGVCGLCKERERPALIQHMHARVWDDILGAYVRCPECGSVFEPGTWNPDSNDSEYVRTDYPVSIDNNSRGILEKYRG